MHSPRRCANESLDEVRRTVVATVVDEHEAPGRLGYHEVCERGGTRRESVGLVVQRHYERECEARFDHGHDDGVRGEAVGSRSCGNA